jgi:oligoribonuclease (3'-5' exoribonuclease)
MLIGIDLETTGLDECQDDILEIAVVAIETPAFKIVDSYSTAVCPSLFGMNRLRANDFVMKMHGSSGLLALIEANVLREKIPDGEKLKPRSERLPFVDEAMAEATAFILKHLGPEGKSPMFGCNPRFDRAFLNVHMNALERKFHYRDLDVNSLWLLREYMTGADPTRSKAGTAHRALADCEQAVANVHQHFEWVSELLRAMA